MLGNRPSSAKGCGACGRWCGIWLISLAVLAGPGCEFDSSGTGNGPPPQLACGLDLSSTQFYVDPQPEWAGLQPGNPLDGEPFWIGWTVHYDGNPGETTDDSAPFNTHVEILDGDEIVWEMDLDSDPIHAPEYRTEGVLIEEGLPPGEYVVSIQLDTEGVVWECFDWVMALNNFVEYPLTVEPHPIDDVVGEGGESPDPSPGGMGFSDPSDDQTN